MTYLSLALMVCAAFGSAPRSLVLSLGAKISRVEEIEQDERAVGASLLSQQQAIELLTGTEPSKVDINQAHQLLKQGRELDAHFKTHQALLLWQQITAMFDGALRPSADLRMLVVEAYHEQVAAHLAAGDMDWARAVAIEATRRFGEQLPNKRRYPPGVLDAFVQASKSVAALPKGRLRIVLKTEGDIMVDGMPFGKGRDRVSFDLPLGDYRVWLITKTGGMSLPHPVVLADPDATTEIHIDAELDACVGVSPTLHYFCEPDENEAANHLLTLMHQLGLQRMVGVPPSPKDPVVLSFETWIEPKARVAPLRAFDPMYLIPAGGAQFAQGRPYFGAAYLLSTAGLLGWNIAATVSHRRTVGAGDVEGEPKWRLERNVSTGLLIGVVLGTVAEALIYSAVAGES